MKDFDFHLNEKSFNLFWRSLADREHILDSRLKFLDPESDEAVIDANDLVYLRLVQENLKKLATKARFSEGAFSLDDEIIDLADL